jgi:phospholipid-transporting ATPase
VPETVERLVLAGIKIWVLTGDKEETAINIAVACNLIQPHDYMDQVILNSTTTETVEQVTKTLRESIAEETEKLAEASKRSGKVGREFEAKPVALVIDGATLVHTMANAEAKALLLAFSCMCKCVVCCRVSPDQKREIVDLVKDGVPGVRTLAIGDGANDVAMINAAHVGVGIEGEEGG